MNDIDEYLSFSQAAQMLGIFPHRIKQLLRDHVLFSVMTEDGRHVIPACILVPDQYDDGAWVPRENVAGTLTLLSDAGYNAEETARWMYTFNEELEQTPIEAIVMGRHHRVNTIAGTLGF